MHIKVSDFTSFNRAKKKVGYTQVVAFKSMVRILLFTLEGEGHLSLMLIGRLCVEVVLLRWFCYLSDGGTGLM